MRDRESLFNEYLLEVRRREKDEKVQKKETVSAHQTQSYANLRTLVSYSV